MKLDGTPEMAVAELMAELRDVDPITKVVLTPQQYEEIRARWEVEDHVPPWRVAAGATFWGLPCHVDPDADTGWVERLSGQRDPIPTGPAGEHTPGV